MERKTSYVLTGLTILSAPAILDCATAEDGHIGDSQTRQSLFGRRVSYSMPADYDIDANAVDMLTLVAQALLPGADIEAEITDTDTRFEVHSEGFAPLPVDRAAEAADTNRDGRVTWAEARALRARMMEENCQDRPTYAFKHGYDVDTRAISTLGLIAGIYSGEVQIHGRITPEGLIAMQMDNYEVGASYSGMERALADADTDGDGVVKWSDAQTLLFSVIAQRLQ